MRRNPWPETVLEDRLTSDIINRYGVLRGTALQIARDLLDGKLGKIDAPPPPRCPRCGTDAVTDFATATYLRSTMAKEHYDSTLNEGESWCIDCDHTWTPGAADDPL